MAIKLTDLIKQNRWWKGEGWISDDSDLKRVRCRIDRKMIEIQKGKLTIFRGIRRSGKTVYLKHIIKKLIEEGTDPRSILYISCDRLNRTRLRNIINDFSIRYGEGYLLLDEITYMDDWELLLKEIMEEGKFTVVATGSNPIKIKQKVERLPGRGVEGNEYFFNPLSFKEFLFVLKNASVRHLGNDIEKAMEKIGKMDVVFQPLKPDVDEFIPFYEEIERLFFLYLLTGGFPDAIADLIRNEGKVKTETYETIIRMFLGTISKEGKSEKMAQLLLERLLIIGTNRVDYQSIGREIDMHHNTVRDYLELLEDARMIYILFPWDLSKKKHSPRKQKKIIFQSPFLPIALNNLLVGGDWDEAIEFLDKNQEWVIEGVIGSHIIWTQERPIMKEKDSFTGFYYANKECDFVLLDKEQFYGFESKYGNLKRSKLPFQTTYITKSEIDKDAIPASLFLLGLEKNKWCI